MPQPATLTTREASKTTGPGGSTDIAAGYDQITDHTITSITVDLVGGLRVRTGNTTMGARDLGGTKLRRVLLALLLHRGAPVSKEKLIALLWDGSPPNGAKATLESYVCVLRKKLQPSQNTRSSLITTQAGCYAIDMSRVDLDVVRYERLMSAALHHDTAAAEALPMLEEAMRLVESPLLPEEIDCEWLDELRVNHQQKVRKGLVAAASKVAGLQPEGAQRWARLALEDDGLDESAWNVLLGSMEASGQHADGLREYDRCRRLLAEELGCTPGPSLQEVYVRLLRGANEDDEQLSLLFDAVVRLHLASQVSQRPTVRLLNNRRSETETGDQATSVTQAYRALDLLLRSVGGDRSNPTMALGA